MSIDSENDLFRKFYQTISDKIERSVYDQRRRKLLKHLDIICLKLASFFNELEDYFVVDCTPLDLCELFRSYRSKICEKILILFLIKGITQHKEPIIADTSCVQFVL
jgi:hypothetical protein